MELWLFSISVIPVILIGLFVFKKDKDKESPKLLLKLALGGIFSFLLVWIISAIMSAIFPFFNQDMTKQNLLQLIISVFIGIAFVEEISKWIFVYMISYNDREFDHIYDGIIYAVFVALGFSFVENLFYVYESGITTGILRAVTAVPAHACFGIFMGYYLGLSKQSKLNNNPKLARKNMILSIFTPLILHGIYDYCIFTEKVIFFILLFGFIVFLYIISLKNIKKLVMINRKMKYKNNFCPNCGNIVDSSFCPFCGGKNE
jgi:protease PrsW